MDDFDKLMTVWSSGSTDAETSVSAQNTERAMRRMQWVDRAEIAVAIGLSLVLGWVAVRASRFDGVIVAMLIVVVIAVSTRFRHRSREAEWYALSGSSEGFLLMQATRSRERYRRAVAGAFLLLPATILSAFFAHMVTEGSVKGFVSNVLDDLHPPGLATILLVMLFIMHVLLVRDALRQRSIMHRLKQMAHTYSKEAGLDEPATRADPV